MKTLHWVDVFGDAERGREREGERGGEREGGRGGEEGGRGGLEGGGGVVGEALWHVKQG